MSEIKTTENGLEIKANKITLNESKPKYITLAVVEYDPFEGTEDVGVTTSKAIVSLPTFCRQVGRGDLITFRTDSDSKPFSGKVLAKQTYDIEGDYLSMLLLAFGHDPIYALPTVEAKIEETKVTW